MKHHKQWRLQLLAGEGEAAAITGVVPAGDPEAPAEEGPRGGESSPASCGKDPSADPGDPGLEERLRALGVPREKLEKHRAALERARVREAKPETESGEQGEKPSLEKLLADPDTRELLKEYANGILRNRVKSMGKEAAAFRTLAPALSALAGDYGLDGRDPEELKNRILEARRQRQGETEHSADPDREEQFRTHFSALRRQEAALKREYPSFDLGEALRDPAFARMVAPDSPLTVEDAFFATHRREILAAREENAREKALEAASRSLQAGKARPRELAASHGAAAATALSREAREELKRRIQLAAARGEKVYPT